MIQEKKIVEVEAAAISLRAKWFEYSNLSIGKKAVKFTIGCSNWENLGPELSIFDYRPATLQATEEIDLSKVKKELVKAVMQPAKVVVMEKIVRNERFQYVNFYPAKGEEKAYFSERCYTWKSYYLPGSGFLEKEGFAIQENNALWSWTTKCSTDLTLSFEQEVILVTLTDDEHKVIVKSWGDDPLTGYYRRKLTIIGGGETAFIDLEP